MVWTVLSGEPETRQLPSDERTPSVNGLPERALSSNHPHSESKQSCHAIQSRCDLLEREEAADSSDTVGPFSPNSIFP